MRFPIKKLDWTWLDKWRSRLTVSQVLTWVSVVSILTASLVAGYYALNVLYQNKLADTWAIMYLELEHEGTLLVRGLNKASIGLGAADSSGDAKLAVKPNGDVESLSGSLNGRLALKDLGVDSPKSLSGLPPINVLSFGGENYLTKYEQNSALDQLGYLSLRKVESKYFQLKPARPASDGALFLMSREGRLLFTNDTSVTEVNVGRRAIVQQFIKAPIKQGQFEIKSPSGDALYGFFAEVPQTNLVLFSEVKKAAAMAPLRQIVLRFFAVLLGILVVVTIILQLPLAKLTAPMRELAELAVSVGEGNFDVSPKLQGFGEITVLSTAFSSMANGLIERDRRVTALMREQTEKMRLAGELAIAKRIQENLLPAAPLPEECGLALAASYVAAAECAGDWYHYAYNPINNETVMVIADVSGHGAGSSVFTAIIAGVFEEYRSRSDALFDIEGFVAKTNIVMHRLGKRQWHATMMAARYVKGSDNLDVVMAGHPLPFFRTPKGMANVVFPASQALGLDPEFKVVLHKVPFGMGSSLLVFTDGLVEAANPANKMYGRKKIKEQYQRGPDVPHQALEELIDNWKTYLDGTPPNDDVCVIAMKALV